MFIPLQTSVLPGQKLLRGHHAKVRHEVDNLAEPEDEKFYHVGQRTEAPKIIAEEGGCQTCSCKMAMSTKFTRCLQMSRTVSRSLGFAKQEPDVDLEEDEPAREHEDLRFRPRPAAEVTFDLPDVLPDLGHVAHIVWREGEHSSETARPAWDAPPPELSRGSIVSAAPKPARPPPPAPRRQPPAAPAKPAAAPQPLLAPSPASPMPVPVQAETAKPQAAQPPVPQPQAAPTPAPAPAPAPPKPAAKGKGKGKGKGPAPPPLPAKKAPAAKAPAPTKETAAGKSAMLLSQSWEFCI